jgi:23S rRNA (adenine2030-N6)-methyltransferase
MLSYRHAFHAGNHADVLKHITQMLVIDKLLQKPKPFVYIDTHSGAGSYRLDSEDALKTRDFESGISKFSNHQCHSPILKRYLDVTQSFASHQHYPGSPMIAKSLMREIDNIVLMEFHNSEIEILRKNLCGYRSGAPAAVHHRDGFEGLIGLMPPTPARGMVLIDPPYELLSEYQQVQNAVAQAVKKWPSGIFVIWYPLLSQRAAKKAGMSEKMCESLAHLPIKSMLDVRMTVAENTQDAGMYGSGLAIINPPWQLDIALQQVLPELNQLLSSQDYKVTSELMWRKRESNT